jgi:UDP-glucuronate 4-epimerase
MNIRKNVLLSVWLIVFFYLSPIFTHVVMVTGGAGFIGSHVVCKLVQQGHKVIIVDLLHPYCGNIYARLKEHHRSAILAQYPHDVVWYRTDIDNMKDLEAIFEKERPSHVCHLAARAGVRESMMEPEISLKTNIIGTLNILECARAYNIEKLVFASSSSVYGNSAAVPFVESQRTDVQTSPYGMSKKAVELLAYVYHYLYKIPCIGLRLFTVYGPWGRMDMAPFLFLDALDQQEPLIVLGDGSATRDFTYIDDVVDGIVAALWAPCDFEIINLGRGVPITINQFIKTIVDIVGPQPILVYKDPLAADVQITHADITKAKTLLNYAPKVSIEEGMRAMYAWYENEYKIFLAQQGNENAKQ